MRSSILPQIIFFSLYFVDFIFGIQVQEAEQSVFCFSLQEDKEKTELIRRRIHHFIAAIALTSSSVGSRVAALEERLTSGLTSPAGTSVEPLIECEMERRILSHHSK